ncbi:hypothetical protein KUCAC02_037775, partial [Chaenocephalus aceratus]
QRVIRVFPSCQTVEMHKEKVSRREIGVFTAARRVPRSHKILPPLLAAGSKPRPPYSRRPISYQQLDGIGHGIKVSGKQAERAALSRSSAGQQAPVQCPVAPLSADSTNHNAPPLAPPLCLETVVEEGTRWYLSEAPSLAPSLCLSEGPLRPRLPLPLHTLSLPACCPITDDPAPSCLPSPPRSALPPLPPHPAAPPLLQLDSAYLLDFNTW